MSGALTELASRPRRPRRWAVAGGLAIVLVTVTAYLPAIRGGYVWDDDTYVTDNVSLRSLDGLREIWFEPETSPQYYPLVFTSFWLEYRIWGLEAAGYHATNVVIHAANALLLWLVLERLGVPGSFLAALLFALHPLQVDSVAWISERKNVLSTMFSLLAFLIWFRSPPPPRLRQYLVAALLFACAVLAKTVAATLPLALLLVAWWKHPSSWRRSIAPLVPMLALGVALSVVTIWRERLPDDLYIPFPALTLLDRCLLAGRELWFYAGKLLWPSPLMTLYPRWRIDSGAPAQYLFAAAALLVPAALWLLRRRFGRGPLVAVALFALTLAPTLGLVDFNFMKHSYVGNHFVYAACIPLLALAAALIARSSRAAAASLTAVPLALLAVLTWERATIYASEETLWRDNLAKNPNAWVAHYNLGNILTRRDEVDEAIGHYNRALLAEPNSAKVHNNLGAALQRNGNLNEAIRHYAVALRLRPDYAVARQNLLAARRLAIDGREAEAAPPPSTGPAPMRGQQRQSPPEPQP